MAKRKKAKSRPAGRKTAKKKTAARTKPARVAKRAPARKAAPAKARAKPPAKPAIEPAARAAPARVPETASPQAAAAPSARAPVATPARAASAREPVEERVGVVTHYYTHLSVAVVRLESGSLRLGDTIHIRGHTSDFRQRVDSMQIEHQPISEAHAGQEFGLKVVEHAREHDVVYKVIR
jgi:putative protease